MLFFERFNVTSKVLFGKVQAFAEEACAVLIPPCVRLFSCEGLPDGLCFGAAGIIGAGGLRGKGSLFFLNTVR